MGAATARQGSTADRGSLAGAQSALALATLGTMTLPFTGDPKADQLLEDEPLALLIGAVLDARFKQGLTTLRQSMPMESGK